MAKNAPLPRFMGLNYKLAITALFFISFFISILIAYFYYSSAKAFQQLLSESKKTHLNSIHSIVNDSASNLQSVITNFSFNKIQDENNKLDQGEVLQLYKRQLENNFYGLVTNWGVDEAYILNEQGDLFFDIKNLVDSSIRINDLNRKENNQKISDDSDLIEVKSLLINKDVSFFIRCKEKCRQYISLHIDKEDKEYGYFVASRLIEYFAEEFYKSNNAYLGLLQPSIISQPSETLIENKDTNSQRWQVGVAQHWSDPIPRSIKNFVDDSIMNNPSKNLSEIKKEDGRYYSITSTPISLTSQEPLQYLIVKDITDDRWLIVQTHYKNILFVSALLSIIFLYFFIILVKSNNRIKQHTNVLPLINDKKFHEARELIYSQRHRSYYRDESDTVDDLITSLTYQFESLDKAVNIRTREMERLSLFDPLTGLANRNLFLYELQSDLDRLTEQDGMLATIMIDLDNFKRLNDSLGHQYGDMLLGKVGLRLKNATRNLGMVARLGGDEFAIILREIKDFSLLEKICKKIVVLTSKAIELDNHSIVINCSLGVALAGKKRSSNDLLKNSEIAMYNAKSRGGNTFSVFSSVMAKEAHDSLTLESDIRRALEQKEFTLYLQPKVTMDNVIQGFEALVRWDHPERGILLPMEFIPAMENMGIINQLDDFVLDASCRQLKSLQTHYPDISIAVNISSMHFTESTFLVYLKSCLDKYPIDPSKIELEITETLLMENMNTGMEIMKQIKEMGVSIAIDDFGTGYSSLSYLKRLPVDTIKIDREFIKDIPDSERDMQISSVIIFLAKQLNFKVVAEGVETREQSVFLKANQCDLAQGFLFSRPIPAHKAMLLLESQGGKIHIASSQSNEIISNSGPEDLLYQDDKNIIKNKTDLNRLIDLSSDTRH
ncbi:MAG: EAL domain-containing protein [Cellvibrionaceae bacterium]